MGRPGPRRLSDWPTGPAQGGLATPHGRHGRPVVPASRMGDGLRQPARFRHGVAVQFQLSKLVTRLKLVER